MSPTRPLPLSKCSKVKSYLQLFAQKFWLLFIIIWYTCIYKKLIINFVMSRWVGDLFIFKFASILHAYCKKKNNIFFHYIQILKFSVKIKIFLDILIVSIMYEPGKVEKVLGNKIGITIYSWTLCPRDVTKLMFNFAPSAKALPHLFLFFYILCFQPHCHFG